MLSGKSVLRYIANLYKHMHLQELAPALCIRRWHAYNIAHLYPSATAYAVAILSLTAQIDNITAGNGVLKHFSGFVKV